MEKSKKILFKFKNHSKKNKVKNIIISDRLINKKKFFQKKFMFICVHLGLNLHPFQFGRGNVL